MFCPTCGAKNEEDYVDCIACGKPNLLPLSSDIKELEKGTNGRKKSSLCPKDSVEDIHIIMQDLDKSAQRLKDARAAFETARANAPKFSYWIIALFGSLLILRLLLWLRH